MEPNNIENQFKDQLNKREIEPSSQAWDRLDSMLTLAEEKKKKPNRSWMFIAASLVTLIALTTVFYIQNSTKEKQEEIIVEKETISPKIQIEQEGTEQIKKNTEIIMKSEITAAGTKSMGESKKAHPEIKKENASNSSLHSLIEEVKLHDNVVALETSKEEIKKSRYVSVDDLLASVQKPKEKPKSGVKIDSDQMLSAVENELNQTFREKVINAVEKNYNSVKTALSSRNQE